MVILTQLSLEQWVTTNVPILVYVVVTIHVDSSSPSVKLSYVEVTAQLR